MKVIFRTIKNMKQNRKCNCRNCKQSKISSRKGYNWKCWKGKREIMRWFNHLNKKQCTLSNCIVTEKINRKRTENQRISLRTDNCNFVGWSANHYDRTELSQSIVRNWGIISNIELRRTHWGKLEIFEWIWKGTESQLR
jgi:hypothetical protein